MPKNTELLSLWLALSIVCAIYLMLMFAQWRMTQDVSAGRRNRAGRAVPEPIQLSADRHRRRARRGVGPSLAPELAERRRMHPDHI